MNNEQKFAIVITTCLIVVLTVALMISVRQIRLNDEKNSILEGVIQRKSIDEDNYNILLSNIQAQLQSKTGEYNSLKEAFSQYCNMTIINLDTTWKLKSVESVTFNNIDQGIQAIAYVNGTHMAAQIYFEDTKVLSQPVLLGTYEELNIK